MGTALINYEERFAADADDLAAREARQGAVLSVRGGSFSLNGESLGTDICVCVVDSYYENDYFPPDRVFDPNNPLPPVCYAFSREKHSDEMGPHPSMQADLSYFGPQHHQCRGCPNNEWGSSSRGRGKACQNRERLYLIPAGYYAPKRGSRDLDLHLFDEAKHFTTADAVALRLPVTSVENWSKFVTQLAASQRRPPYAVYTHCYVEPHPKSQFKIHFEYIANMPDHLYEPIVQRVDGQQQLPFSGYLPPDQTTGAAVIDQYGRPMPGRFGLRGLHATPVQQAAPPPAGPVHHASAYAQTYAQRFGR